MIPAPRLRAAAAVRLVAALALLSSLAAPARAEQCLTQINEDGFGDFTNRYAWSMAVFQDRLYVGTYNVVYFGLDGLEDTKGGEIWRWDGTSWERVVVGGLGDRWNVGIRNLVVFGGRLYGTTYNPYGTQVWRSDDGERWEVVARDGFGESRNRSGRGMAVFGGRLWIGTERAEDEGPAELWSSADGTTWTRSDVPGLSGPETLAFSVLFPYAGGLYVSSWDQAGPGKLHRLDDGVATPLVGGGAATPGGFGHPETAIMDLASFAGHLYASTVNFDIGFEVWRSADLGLSWTRVLGQPTAAPHNRYGWRMVNHRGRLFVGTLVTGPRGQTNIGAELFSTSDGLAWTLEVGAAGTLAGPGLDDKLNYGIRTMAEFRGDLMIGTAQCYYCAFQPITGGEVWRRVHDVCVPSIGCSGSVAGQGASALGGVALLAMMALRTRRRARSYKRSVAPALRAPR